MSSEPAAGAGTGWDLTAQETTRGAGLALRMAELKDSSHHCSARDSWELQKSRRPKAGGLGLCQGALRIPWAPGSSGHRLC